MSTLTELTKAIERLPAHASITEEHWHTLHDCIPDPKPENLFRVYNIIAELAIATPRVRLIAVLACLKGEQNFECEKEAAEKLSDYAAAAIAPCSRTESGVEDAAADTEDYEDIAQRVRGLAIYGLEILRICSDEYNIKFSQDTLLTVISYTDTAPAERPSETTPIAAGSQHATQPHAWVTAEVSELAGRVLATQRFEPDPMLTTVLQDYLRPLFSKSRPSAVTASGRKAEFRDEQDITRGLREENGEVKPWKYLDHRAMAVFQWAVSVASVRILLDGLCFKANGLTRNPQETLISQQWPMFIPVLLTILDDITARVRYVGLIILPEFLSKFPDNTLHNTGLASVFEDAVFPTLHFLPSTTPEAESIQLLAPAYRSLVLLSRKLVQKVKSEPNTARTPRPRLLDKVLRDGVFSGYSHAKDHARIARLLFQITEGLVKEMGIHAVKHLKDLIPMHCEVLSDPFAIAAPELLECATQSLAAVFSVCWPRLYQAPYQDELIKALVLCFLNVQDDPEYDGKLKPTRETLLVLAQMLSVLEGKDADESCFKDKVTPLIAKEPVLKMLFSNS